MKESIRYFKIPIGFSNKASKRFTPNEDVIIISEVRIKLHPEPVISLAGIGRTITAREGDIFTIGRGDSYISQKAFLYFWLDLTSSDFSKHQRCRIDDQILKEWIALGVLVELEEDEKLLYEFGLL